MTTIHKTLITLICVFFISPVFAFEILTRSDGSQIAIYDNGTWKVYSEDKLEESKGSVDMSCENLLAEVRDKRTGRYMTVLQDPVIATGKRKLGLMITVKSPGKKKGRIIFNTKIIGSTVCVSEAAPVKISFKDGSTLNLKSDNRFNCKGETEIYFGGNSGKLDQLNELETKKISSIRVRSTSYKVEKKISPEMADVIQNAVSCLLNR